jgi:hypothetical protein
MGSIRHIAHVSILAAAAALAGCATTTVERPYMTFPDYAIYRLPAKALGCLFKGGADQDQCILAKARERGKAKATAWCAKDGMDAFEREARLVTLTLPVSVPGVGSTVRQETVSSVNYFFHCQKRSPQT